VITPQAVIVLLEQLGDEFGAPGLLFLRRKNKNWIVLEKMREFRLKGDG